VNCIKERPGTRQEARVSTLQTIRNALANSKRSDALHSFAIALLPFFEPDKELVKRLESLSFSMTMADAYVKGIEPHKFFGALAFYCLKVGFKFRDELDLGLKELASKFEGSSGIVTMVSDSGLNAIQIAIHKWLPNVGKTTVTATRAKMMAEDVINMMFVEYARENDDGFKVYLLDGRI
jgi:hypothetical protein